jgi:pimeloyl-ACP methyl ester carboxylesterase
LCQSHVNTFLRLYKPVRRCAGGGWRRLPVLLLLPLLLSGCAVWNDWQRGVIYRPTPISPAQWQHLLATRPDASARTVAVQGAAEQVQVLQLAAQPGQVAPVRVFYLHGTYRQAWQNLGKAAPMLSAGLDVFMPDYRGWGASSPRVPSEASIVDDAWAAWQALQGAQTVEARPVRWVIFGHSMGSAVAVQLAQRLRGQKAYCALVLESAFTSFPDVAAAGAGWGGRLVSLAGSERMASIERIGEVDPPVWFLHGSRDRTVPLALGQQLYQAAPAPKHWRQWDLGHSDLQTDPTGGYDRTWRDIAEGCG